MNSGELFQDSYERASGQTVDGQDFFTHFYTVFLAADKAVAEKFINTDMAHQKSMLKKSFYSLYSFHISTNTDYLLEKIARKHGKGNMNISPVLYDIWLESLIQTVTVYDPQFNREIELAWRLVLAPGIAFMKFHSA